MWRFVLQKNIQRFRLSLEDTRFSKDWRRIRQQLAEAESELKGLETSSTGAPGHGSRELRTTAEYILDDAIRLHGAQFGNVQLFDANTRTLAILAQRNFQRPFLQHFATVACDDGSACGRAIDGGRVVIEDVSQDRTFLAHRGIAHEAGFIAVQSTPLRDREGHLIAMVSTHFAEPRNFSGYELAAMDRHAEWMGQTLERQLLSTREAD